MKIFSIIVIVFGLLGVITSILAIKKRSSKETSKLIVYGIAFILGGYYLYPNDSGSDIKNVAPVVAQSEPQQVNANKDTIIRQQTPAKDQFKDTDTSPKKQPDVKVVSVNGGLGDGFEQVVKIFGQPTRSIRAMNYGAGWYGFQDNLVLATFSEGRLQRMDFQLDTQKKNMTVAQAREFIKKLMPADATPVKEYDKDATERVLVFNSKTLAGLFSETKFENRVGDVVPGEFDIVLIHSGDDVAAISAFTSDNP